MTASVLHLLESLEARLERTKAELDALREENAQLKQQLAAQQRAASDKRDESTQRPAASFHSQGNEHSPGYEGDGHEKGGIVTPEVPHQESCQAEPEAAVVQTAAPQTVVPQTEAPQTQASQVPVSQAPSPQALLKQWYQRYPKAFFKGHTKPLKVGIHHDLAQSEPWSGKLIRRALANYVNLPRYVKSMREGAERVDLDGNPAGKVDKEAALHARERRKERPVTEASNATQNSVATNSVATQRNAAKIKSAASSSFRGEGVQGESNRNSSKNHAEVEAVNTEVVNTEVRAEVKTTHTEKSGQAKSHGLGNSLEEKLKGLQQKFKAH